MDIQKFIEIADSLKALMESGQVPATTATTLSSNNILDQFIGKYVIVRTREAGVHAGVLQAANGRSCVLSEARRLWYWKCVPNKGDFLSSIALHGLHPDSKLGEALPSIALTENCEIIPCSQEAEASIRGQKTHGKQ